MSGLQQAPQGWLGALGLKAVGKNPDVVSDTINGVLEAGHFYFPPQVRQQTQTVTSPLADGSTISLVVPDGEAWIVYAAGGSIPFAATDALVDDNALVLSYAQNSQTPTMQLAVGPVRQKGAIVTSGSLQVGALFPRPIIFPPKSVLSIRSSGQITLAANRTAQINALIYPFTP
jgi:hypothetical protein